MILITGATGFIGSRMAELFHQQDENLVLIGRLRNEIEQKRAAHLESLGLQLTELDLVEDDLTGLLKGVDHVIHLAAAQHEANQSEAYFQRVNVEGTKRLLEAAIQAGVRRLVYGSTIGVYGQALNGEIDEHSSVAPDNHYGRTKLAAEQLVQSYSDKIEVSVARISETYGPGDYRLLKMFRGIKKGMFPIIGSGRNSHQLVYVDDLIAGLKEMTSNESAIGQTLVLSGDEIVTTQEMCENMANALDRPLRSLRFPMWPFFILAVILEQTLGRVGIQPPLHRRRLDFFRKSFFFSPTARNRTLEWRPEVSFQEGTKRTAQWYHAAGLLDQK